MARREIKYLYVGSHITAPTYPTTEYPTLFANVSTVKDLHTALAKEPMVPTKFCLTIMTSQSNSAWWSMSVFPDGILPGSDPLYVRIHDVPAPAPEAMESTSLNPMPSKRWPKTFVQGDESITLTMRCVAFLLTLGAFVLLLGFCIGLQKAGWLAAFSNFGGAMLTVTGLVAASIGSIRYPIGWITSVLGWICTQNLMNWFYYRFQEKLQEEEHVSGRVDSSSHLLSITSGL